MLDRISKCPSNPNPNIKMRDFLRNGGTRAVFSIDFYTMKNNLFEKSKCAIYLRINTGTSIR